MLRTVDGKLTTYDFGIIIYKMEKEPFTIYDLFKETIIYYKEWMKFDIAEIGYYNIIFGMP